MDGRELFYYQPDGAIMAVSIDAAADGRRFLITMVDPGSLSRPDDVAIEWPRLLQQRG